MKLILLAAVMAAATPTATAPTKLIINDKSIAITMIKDKGYISIDDLTKALDGKLDKVDDDTLSLKSLLITPLTKMAKDSDIEIKGNFTSPRSWSIRFVGHITNTGDESAPIVELTWLLKDFLVGTNSIENYDQKLAPASIFVTPAETFKNMRPGETRDLDVTLTYQSGDIKTNIPSGYHALFPPQSIQLFVKVKPKPE
jgi:hypothetical protein